MAAQPPYGYKKDPNDKNHLVIDEEAAEVVRLIFDLQWIYSEEYFMRFKISNIVIMLMSI